MSSLRRTTESTCLKNKLMVINYDNGINFDFLQFERVYDEVRSIFTQKDRIEFGFYFEFLKVQGMLRVYSRIL